MKISQSVALAGIGILLGFGVGVLRDAQGKAELNREAESLRAGIAQAGRSQAEAIAQRDRWKAEADRLREWAEEVHPLRAEASRLRRELSEAQASLERSAALLKKFQGVEKAQTSDKPQMVEKMAKLLGKGEGKVEGVIPLESAPPAVSATIAREMGGGQMRVLHTATEDGKATYGVKGQLADGRAIGMRLAEDGTLLEKSTEIPAETLPVQIQSPVAQAFGDINISSARQIVDGGNVSYELGAKGPNMGMQIMVREDGTILAYSAKFRAPEPKGK